MPRGRPRQEIRIIDGVPHKWCAHHKAWEPLTEFDLKDARGTYWRDCRVARMAQRDLANRVGPADEFTATDTGIDTDLDALAWKFVEARSDDVVRKFRYLGLKVTRQWVLTELNYISLVPYVRALIGPDGLCAWCGQPFTKKHRISLDHILPPRWDGTLDLERLHAQNIQVMHFGENGSKGEKDFSLALHQNMQRWMAERDWARHAGEPGWPSLEAMKLPPPEALAPEPNPEPQLYQLTFDDLLAA